MATLSANPRTNRITVASATVGPFPVGFRLFDSDGLTVYVDGINRADWTLSAAFVGGYTDDAKITFLTSVGPGVVQIDGSLIPDRKKDYINGDPGLTTALNIELARIWSAVSEIKMMAGRSLRGFDLAAPIPDFDVGDIANVAGSAAAAAASADAAANSAAEALTRELSMFRPRGFWQTGVYYTASDVVYFGGSSYYALLPHFGTDFATDFASGRWFVLAQQGAAGSGTGDMLNSENLINLANKSIAFANLGGKALGRVDLLTYSLVDPSLSITSAEGLARNKVDNAFPVGRAVTDYVDATVLPSRAIAEFEVSGPTSAITLRDLAGWDEVEISAELTSSAGLYVRVSPDNGVTIRSTNYDVRVSNSADTDISNIGFRIAGLTGAGVQRFTMRINEMANALRKTGASGDAFYFGGARGYSLTGAYNVPEICNALQVVGGTITAGWVSVKGIRRAYVEPPAEAFFRFDSTAMTFDTNTFTMDGAL